MPNAATPPGKKSPDVLAEALAFAAANARRVEKCGVCRLPPEILAGVHAMKDQVGAEYNTISAWLATKGHAFKHHQLGHHLRQRAAGQGHGASR